jgi:hypothetical protein
MPMRVVGSKHCKIVRRKDWQRRNAVLLFQYSKRANKDGPRDIPMLNRQVVPCNPSNVP